MAVQRLRRDAQVERNRGLLLAAARRVFLARGFHGATLDAIAEEAGFSKGVVYSQFDSKADLFLALLEQRIAERAEENERILREAEDPRAGFATLLARGAERARRERAWELLLLEFRCEAARRPALNRRYAAAHARTVDGVSRVLVRILAAAGQEPPAPPHVLAAFVLGVASGAALENFAEPEALPPDALAALLGPAVGLAPEERT